MTTEVREVCWVMLTVFLLISLLKQLVKPEPIPTPNCMEYGYDANGTTVMNTKNNLLTVVCIEKYKQ